jgi:UPF0176 protein
MENLTTEPSFTNIAYYKFVEILDPHELRKKLLPLCQNLGLKGTILLAHEGMNSCLVGTAQAIDEFIHILKNEHPLFAEIDFKKSYSSHVPFQRMLVKIKKEIIPMGKTSIQPQRLTGKYMNSLELKKWFDTQKQDFVILDTRNAYETQLGSFRGAIDPQLSQFRDFPQWVTDHFLQHKTKTVVTFCTGGIRCEKATAYLLEQGFQDVYQLQGGILKYFEETQIHAPQEDNHYDGDCFVFDYRVALNKRLEQSHYTLCYSCWATLTPEDRLHPQYQKGHHCASCFQKHQTS